MDEIIVVIPTVRERAALCAETVAQWQTLGYVPLICCMPDDAPRSPEQQGRWALACLVHAQEKRTSHALFCEDDVLLDGRIPAMLPRLAAATYATTLYLPGKRFYPASIWRQPVPETPQLFAIRNHKQWFGAQCLYLPASLIAGLLSEQHAPAGFDILLRDYLIRHHMPLYSIYPNLVQHISPPSVTSRRYKAHRSLTWMS